MTAFSRVVAHEGYLVGKERSKLTGSLCGIGGGEMVGRIKVLGQGEGVAPRQLNKRSYPRTLVPW